ncbi:hypothetical protein [uncultured Hyphomonas sp.]|uniref:hypothetical protein n=1 Tax=uncultured Hyphomonas sp. TaxID=225298 RepID=UPI002AABBF1A|nr:hypothetical protein [uncultured Hyphomonas sp.]
MSLFHPPSWFPPQLAFLWPLVWVQVLMLRAEIRAAYGRGVKYHWSLTPNLRVYLYSIDWIPGQGAGREGLMPRAHPSDRLAAACDGRAAVPAYLSNPANSAHTGAPAPLQAVMAVLDAVCRDGVARMSLPLPDT